MEHISGNLLKMRSELTNPVTYYLDLNGTEVCLNELLGCEIKLEYTGQINCIKCSRKTTKSFSQGFCYPCFQSAPETEECVLRPELCKAHEGIARDMEFAKSHCLIKHIVYLSLTSGIKVGVTRSTQIPTRWIDQGATKAIVLAQTPNRYTAGLVEVALKKVMADKTNWRNMLTNKAIPESDLFTEKDKAAESLPEDLFQYHSPDDRIYHLEYPVLEYPEKVSSLNFDKQEQISGTLTGIKGQYLYIDTNQVINIRKFGGYQVMLEY